MEAARARCERMEMVLRTRIHGLARLPIQEDGLKDMESLEDTALVAGLKFLAAGCCRRSSAGVLVRGGS